MTERNDKPDLSVDVTNIDPLETPGGVATDAGDTPKVVEVNVPGLTIE